MDEKLKELEGRITKLEGKKSLNLWLQFLVFPILLAVMGYYFQTVLTASKDKIERLKTTQTILNDIFSEEIPQKTVALKRILDELLDDPELAEEMCRLIDAHIEQAVKKAELAEFNVIYDAVALYSDPQDTLLKTLQASETVQKKLADTQWAKKKEKEAFSSLMQGNLWKAEQSFRQVDSIYPGYHRSDSLYRYLNSRRAWFNNPNAVKNIQEKVRPKIPLAIKQELGTRVNER